MYAGRTMSTIRTKKPVNKDNASPEGCSVWTVSTRQLLDMESSPKNFFVSLRALGFITLTQFA